MNTLTDLHTEHTNAEWHARRQAARETNPFRRGAARGRKAETLVTGREADTGQRRAYEIYPTTQLPVAAHPSLVYIRRKAPVAQLDRALPSEGRGHRFESCRVRQFSAVFE